MAAWIALPLSLRLLLLGGIGLLAGALVNWAIYALAWFPLPVSPWSPVPGSAARRAWPTRIPVVGWWLRGTESADQRIWAVARFQKLGYEVPADWRPRLPFWLRPLLIEVGLGLALPGLYWLETEAGTLLPEVWRQPATLAGLAPWTNWIFWGHAVLLLLMVVATFIDLDEQTIPDAITVPGTLFALVWGTVSLAAFLPCTVNGQLLPCLMTLPSGWSPQSSGTAGLLLAIAIWTAWCFALANRRVILRRGWKKGVQYFFAALVRPPGWKVLAGLFVAGLLAIPGVWGLLGGAHWQGLLTALVGLAVGGGTVWAVRLVAGWAMGEEAMGFGDVTLMGMIGAFLGWQASLMAFFLAPLAAIAIFLLQRILTGERAQAFGPYLCVGAAATVLGWPTFWGGLLLPNLNPLTLTVLLACLLLMGVLLSLWRGIKALLWGGR